MVCPLCSARKARRRCPALGRDICPTCCATKRLTEIRCPGDCSWLVAARAHPPAAVLRQRERDARLILPMVDGLSERSYQALMLLQEAVASYRASAIPPLLDADVREAAGALAATLETSARGIIYSHQVGSLPAQRLLSELRQTVEGRLLQAGRNGSAEREVALSLRRIEWAAREAKARLEATDTAYVDLLARLPFEPPEPATGLQPILAPAAARKGGLILVP